jgi:DNA-binding CsgD family transcriptional regulator
MRILSFVLVLYSSLSLRAQEHPPLVAYTPDLYSAQNQNWDISQTSDQTMYFANNSGLLEFDGTNWSLYSVPDNTIVRSVKAVGNDVYSGSYMDFGVWKRNNKNVLEYTSLVQKLGIDLTEDEQFWKIIKLDDWLVFHSFSRIYLVNEVTDEFSFIESEHSISNIFVVNGVLFFNKTAQGLFQFVNGSEKLVSNDPRLLSQEAIEIFDLGGRLLILTASNGFYYFDKGVLSPWEVDTKVDLKAMSVYSATKLKDNSIVIGTVSNGYFHFTSDGKVKYDLNFEKGLSNNTVLSVYEDQQNNLWLGLDIGISFINLSTQFTVYNDTKGTIGTVYASLVLDDYLYLGTNQGLFYKRRNSASDFKFIEGTNGQVWSLKIIDNLVFCGHHSGTLIIQDQRIKSVIDNAPGTWDFKMLADNPNIILQGNYSGLSLLEKISGKWGFRNKIKGFDLSTRFYEQKGSKIFVNHELRGLYELILSDDLLSVSKGSLVSSVSKGNGSNILKFSNKLYYASSEGVFKYSEEAQEFRPSEAFNEVLNAFSLTSTLLDVKGSNGLKWCFADDSFLILSSGSITKIPKTDIIPVSLDNFKKVVSGFENLTKIGVDEFLLGSSNGYFIFNSSTLKPSHLFNIKLKSVEASRINEDSFKLDLKKVTNLDYDINSLYFSYTIPHYDNIVEKKYAYKLEGWSEQWSDWSEQSYQVFKNLPFGSYEFKVKGKTGITETLNTTSFSFVIERPWYLSNLAISLYALLLIFSWIIIHNSYKIYYKKQQLKAIRKSEENLAIKELESSKKLVQLKNEKLKLDIESKNRELAVSTMSLIKKNEFLHNIKKELKDKDGAGQDLKKVIKIIDKNLNNTDDWKLFEEAFNNADKDFLKQIKTMHPSLTPNDLRLCAYLRLNLTSKEIAPLLNISYRSVEVKRYRLRKKMNLPHESSLTSYILEI